MNINKNEKTILLITTEGKKLLNRHQDSLRIIIWRTKIRGIKNKM